METWEIILIAVFAVVALIALGGGRVVGRRNRAGGASLEARLEEVNRQLAAAHAADKGWERSALESAARTAFEQQRPSEAVRELVLVQVVDNPGTDQDSAVFRVRTDAGESQLTLGRRAGDWFAQSVS